MVYNTLAMNESSPSKSRIKPFNKLNNCAVVTSRMSTTSTAATAATTTTSTTTSTKSSSSSSATEKIIICAKCNKKVDNNFIFNNNRFYSINEREDRQPNRPPTRFPYVSENSNMMKTPIHINNKPNKMISISTNNNTNFKNKMNDEMNKTNGNMKLMISSSSETGFPEDYDTRSQCCKCATEFVFHKNNNIYSNNMNKCESEEQYEHFSESDMKNNNNKVLPNNKQSQEHQQTYSYQQQQQQQQQQHPQQRSSRRISVIGRHKNFQAVNHSSLSSSSSSSSSSSMMSSSSIPYVPPSSSSSLSSYKTSSSLSSSSSIPSNSSTADQKFNDGSTFNISCAEQYDFEDFKDDDDEDERVDADEEADEDVATDNDGADVVLTSILSSANWMTANNSNNNSNNNNSNNNNTIVTNNGSNNNNDNDYSNDINNIKKLNDRNFASESQTGTSGNQFSDHHHHHHQSLHHHHHNHHLQQSNQFLYLYHYHSHPCHHHHHEHHHDHHHDEHRHGKRTNSGSPGNDDNHPNGADDDDNVDGESGDDDDVCREGANDDDDDVTRRHFNTDIKNVPHNHGRQQQQKQQQLCQQQRQQIFQHTQQVNQHKTALCCVDLHSGSPNGSEELEGVQSSSSQLSESSKRLPQLQTVSAAAATTPINFKSLSTSSTTNRHASSNAKTFSSSSSVPLARQLVHLPLLSSTQINVTSLLSPSTQALSSLPLKSSFSSPSSSSPSSSLAVASKTVLSSSPGVSEVIPSSLDSSTQKSRIRKSSSLLVSKKKMKKRQKSQPNNDDDDDDEDDNDENKTMNKNNKTMFVSSVQIDHVAVNKIDDVIKCSRSLPSQLNAKDPAENKKDWRNVVTRPIRTEGKKLILDEIMSSVRHSKKTNTSIDEPQILTRRVKRTFKSLFNMTPKLHKSFKKGLYIVSLVHQKGKVLVTGEDVLPTIEIQCEQTPSSVALKSDFYWLSKVICNWSNVKPLKNIFERPSTITDSLHFRSCLLQSVYQMQKIVGYEDLGNLHYQILNDPNSGSQIFLFIKNLPDDLRVTSSLKWGSVNKLIKKKMNSFEKSEEKAEQAQMDTNTMDYITANIPDLVSFNDSCVTRLPRGLYVGYVKLTSYIDQLRIIVPDNLSNVFPFVQVRNNAKVSSEEWDSLINLTSTPTKLNKVDSTLQHNFINQLYESSLELMRDVGVPEEDFLEHRVYMNEVFEFSSEVSFILLMPNFKQVCSGLGEEEKTIPGHISLPLQQFEIYHMKTYHPDLTKRYALLSTLLEAEVGVTNHLIRQGVSSDDEMKLRKEIQVLNQQQKKLDDAWKSMRWIAEVIGNARDSKSTSCLALEILRSRLNSPEDSSDASLTSTDTNLTFTFSTNFPEDVSC